MTDSGPGHLDERILEALHRLSGEIAFNGLRRVLGAHPESLSRALRRLEREGLVARVGGAYRAIGPAEAEASVDGSERLRSVAEVELPAHVSAESLTARLAARWFGSLRWVGFVDRPDERLLAWAPRSGGGVVLLSARAGRLRVLVPNGLGRPDPGEAEDAAYELLFHAAEALRVPGTRGITGALTFQAPAPGDSPAGPENN